MLNNYGLLGLIKLIQSWILTRLFYPSARLIRFPFDIRGRKQIVWGSNFTTGFGCRIEAYSTNKSVVLHIGNNVQINDYVHITAMQHVSIGDNVLLASKIYISDCSHGSYTGTQSDTSPLIPPNDRPFSMKRVVIEDNVWVGEFVSVLPGVTIGKGTIIGSNSVVSKSLPPYVIAVGIPACPIKKYNFETKRWETINK